MPLYRSHLWVSLSVSLSVTKKFEISPSARNNWLWSCMVPYGTLWSLMVPHGPLWIHMVLYGPLWPPMDLYGSIWFRVVPPYWPQILGIKFFFTIQVNPILVQFLHLYNSCIFRGACTFESVSQGWIFYENQGNFSQRLQTNSSPKVTRKSYNQHRGPIKIKNVPKSGKSPQFSWPPLPKEDLDFFEFGKNLKFDDPPPLVPNLGKIWNWENFEFLEPP